MLLYTINNNHPDKNFNFTLTTANMTLAPSVHTHTYSGQTALASALNAKAATGHTHTCVTSLYTAEVGSGYVPITLTAVATSGSVNPSVTLSGQTVSVNFVSPETGNVGGILDQNAEAPRAIVQLYGGIIYTTDDIQASYITMEENTYA